MACRRFYVRYGSPPVHAIVHSDDRYTPPDPPPPFFKAEIPPRFWWVSLAEVEAFYERGEKPRLRVRLMETRLMDDGVVVVAGAGR